VSSKRTALSVLLPLMFLALPLLAQKPIQSAETNWNGVALDLMTVERKGSVLTVKWAVRNHSAGGANVTFALAGHGVTTYAVDEEHGAKYYVLADKEGHSLASEHVFIDSEGFGINQSVAAGESKRFWMKLPAPPPAVKKLTLFFTKTEPFEDVPITEK
jgi:hypothetical protein